VETIVYYFKTPWAFWLVDHFHWMWPLCETVHFLGMAMLVGIVGMLDLRMLGVARGLPIAPMQRLIPWAVVGFVLNLATGFIFVSAAPSNYAASIAFRLKVLFILLAGLNVLLFYVTGLARRVDTLGPGDDAPAAAKAIAAISLFLWVGVMFWGRMLPFLWTAGANAE
jgi:hypothetical protein